ncbi:MAG: hypothetical protein ACM3VT_02640, partial [Solirubrobacterales bacterium]
AGTCYGDLLDLGVDTQEQLKRAVTGYYLAFCRQDDAPHVQRQILAGLDAWLAERSQQTPSEICREVVVQKVVTLRAGILGERPVGSGLDVLAGGSGSCPNGIKGGGLVPQDEGKPEI